VGAAADGAQGTGLGALQHAAPEELQRRMRAASTRTEGERKPVTILFADIVGSTAIAEGLDPEEWKEIVAGVHRRAGEAVYRYEGTVAQLLGDGVLAFFGAPITHEDDPIRAARAALDLQESIGEFSRELSGLVQNLQMRVGINTGEVVIGEIGTDLHVEYLAIGDAVNAAARLESAAAPGSILISARCARLIGEGFRLGDRGEIAVKGKAKPIHVYEVRGVEGMPVPRRGGDGTRGAYVGRMAEVERLRSAIETVGKGQGGIVALMGEAGIGKSRLLEEVRREFEAGQGPDRWLEGRALSYGGSLPYWPITQLILDDLELAEGAPALKVKVALRKRLKELFAGGIGEPYAYLGRLLGIPEEAEAKARLDSMDAESIKAETLATLREYFRGVARRQPTAVVVEDLHWADPSSLEVLQRLMGVADREALLILMLMRVDRDHGSWGLKVRAETDYPHRYTEIQLGRLTDRQVDDLLEKLLGGGALPPRIRGIIRDRAEGNPFYLEEVARHLVDNHEIERVGAAWQATAAIEEVGIPETLQGVLLARIDRLEEDVRGTLQMASVIGKSFLYRILEAVSAAERELEGQLTELQREDLVREKARIPELEYMFKHSLTQEATYSSLLLERRKEFHLKVGEAIERLFPERRGEFLGLLAHHFEAAGAREKAAEYLIRAGDQARLAFANEEGIDFYRRALPILQELGEHETAVKLLMKLGLTCYSAFQFEAARQAYDQAFSLSTQVVRSPPKALPPAFHPLRIDLTDLPTLDPAKAIDSTSFVVINQLFRGLVRMDVELNLRPDVAERWEVLEGGRRYVFHLNPEGRWSDGAPVTAGDFEFAWKRLLNPGTSETLARYLFDIENGRAFHREVVEDDASVGVFAEDDRTLVVNLEGACSYFLHLLAMPILVPVPAHIVRRDPEGWATSAGIVGNGPFLLERIDASQSLTLRRNPGYWGEVRGNIQEVVVGLEGNPMDELARYQRGESALLRLTPFVFKQAKPNYRGFSEEFYSVPDFLTFYLGLNARRPPFDDPRVRRAFAMALDRGQFADVVFDGAGFPARGGFIPPGLPAHSDDIGLPFSPDRARAALEAAGFEGGEGFPSVEGLAPYWAGDATNYSQRQWKDVLGVDVTWRDVSWPELLEALRVSPPDVYGMSWQGDYPDPDSFLRASSWRAETGWVDERYDSLIEEARRVPDPERRADMYRQADRILMREAPIIPLMYGRAMYLIKPWLRAVPVLIPGKVPNFEDLIIEPH
jgi:ABC-type oligopeptide transport system substrate-binding subunit/class 3 adenylate cyclase